MVAAIVALLVMMNPFAIFIYMDPIMKSLHHRGFLMVFVKATAISFFVLLFFFLVGEVFFKNVLQINFDSFRIFGGIVVFSFAYLFIVSGRKAIIMMKENLDDLASEIAIPFIVGMGSISLIILFSKKLSVIEGIITVSAVLSANFIIILLLKLLRDKLPGKKLKVAFDKNMQVLMRIMGFFIGAIGIDLIIKGIKGAFNIP